MHIHKLEKYWLTFGIILLAVFLTVLGVSAFAAGNQPASDADLIDPAKVNQTAPFDKPGLHQIGENEYELVMIAQAFTFTPGNVEIPKGAKVTFLVTYTFEEAGEFLILCNEYCGTGHHMMSTKIKVVE